MGRTKYLCTWFYAESADDESYYPSAGKNTSSNAFHKVYWRCIFDFYKSAVLTQKCQDISYLFFTNVKAIPEDVDGVSLRAFFDEIHVEVVYQELTNKTPADWYEAWRNQFYLYDILERLRDREGAYIILDSDCIIMRDLSPVFRKIIQDGLLPYYDNHAVDSDYPNNGTSNRQLGEIYKEVYGESAGVDYVFGEFVGITENRIGDVMREYRRIWEVNYRRYLEHRVKLNEEAHFLSLICTRLRFTEPTAKPFIKRLWTAVKYDTCESGDERLHIWHLPAEKRYGLRILFRWLNKKEHSRMEFLVFARKLFLIPGNRTRRRLRKFLQKAGEYVTILIFEKGNWNRVH